MEINIKRSGEVSPGYESLRPGDTFMLPAGNTVYLVTDHQRASNCPYHAVNLRNGNLYGCFKGRQVVPLTSKLIAWPKEN